MTQMNAVATSPVLFFTDDGRLIQIPISTIKFNGNDVNTTLPGDASTTKLHAYLQYLAKTGELVPEKAPPPANVLVATAAVDGPTGNRITITVVPATGANVTITVTQIDVYPGLKLSTLEAIVGTGTTPGSAPGMFKVTANGATASPPVNGNIVVGTGPDANTWTIADSSPAGSPVVLAPIRATPASGYAAGDFTVTISDAPTGVPPADATFTLTVTWSHTITVAAAAALPAAFAELRYLVTFTSPTTDFKVPRPGTTTLVGGLAPAPGQPATTTLLANA